MKTLWAKEIDGQWMISVQWHLSSFHAIIPYLSVLGSFSRWRWPKVTKKIHRTVLNHPGQFLEGAFSGGFHLMGDISTIANTPNWMQFWYKTTTGWFKCNYCENALLNEMPLDFLYLPDLRLTMGFKNGFHDIQWLLKMIYSEKHGNSYSPNSTLRSRVFHIPIGENVQCVAITHHKRGPVYCIAVQNPGKWKEAPV